MAPRSTSSNTISRPRARAYFAILGLVLCAISYTIVWNGDFVLSAKGGLRRRRLAYLDSLPAPSKPYGRTMIDQNFQSMLHPSRIDASIFRKQSTMQDTDPHAAEAACDDVFLFLPYSFAHNGHGSQLNSYILAIMISTFANRALVILEPPNEMNVFKGNSQFGCPPDAWETVKLRKGGVPKKVGWDPEFPTGLDRLIKHPQWLSRGCPVPCQDTMGYEEWDELRQKNNATDIPIPEQFQCTNDNGRQSNVIVMGGNEARRYFISHYKERMVDRMQPPSIPAVGWALRLGAAPHEARVFGGLTERHDIYDYAMAMISRAGAMRFQPWIARDAEAYIHDRVDLPLDVPYDSIHIRRGDKLDSDARRFVMRYWGDMGLYNEETGEMPQKYIPFTFYLSRLVGQGQECNAWNAQAEPRLVYVATDDPHEVQREINDFPKDAKGNTILPNSYGQPCFKYRFVFNHINEELMTHTREDYYTSGFHIDADVSKGSCEERYERNIAGIADLMILAKSDIFVGEFNSNWGRLVRTFRLTMNNSVKVMNGQRPVIEKEMRVAWGNQRPGPPGW